MTRRKPVPRNDNQETHDEQTQNTQPQQSPFVDPQIRRYTLTDGPSTPNSTNSEQDAISEAVNKLLRHRYSAVPSTDQMTEVSENDTSSHAAEGKSLSRESSASGATVIDLRDGYGNGSDDSHASSEEPPHLPQRPPTVPPYQPGQLLPTIITGETLNLDEYGQEIPNGTQDSFTDVQALSYVPLPTTKPYTHYDQDFPDTPALPPHPSEGYHYMPPQDPDQLYQHSGSEPGQAGSDGFVDHFHHDTEAYASGNLSRASYRPPRSRSPTPAVDDEDYHIVGSDGVHYTGFPQPPHLRGWEAEKIMYEQSYDHGRYLNEKYADAFGQDVGYPYDDDGEKTPVSTLNYLEPETPVETRHFGPAPTGRIHRRHKSKKRVQLTNGNLVVDINVPPKMVLPYRGEPEMTTTRYTAVTCDPDKFEKNGFFLRQNESGRRTELFIVITMYNVGDILTFPTYIITDTVLICRKMRFYSVEQCTESCGISNISAHGRILRLGVQMHGKRCTL